MRSAAIDSASGRPLVSEQGRNHTVLSLFLYTFTSLLSAAEHPVTSGTNGFSRERASQVPKETSGEDREMRDVTKKPADILVIGGMGGTGSHVVKALWRRGGVVRVCAPSMDEAE